jgi:hypothetical protein
VFVQGNAGTDYQVDVNIGGVTGCYGTTELATLKIHSAQNVGTVPAAPCQLVGHGVTGSTLMSIKGSDANSIATVYVRGPESGITGPCFVAELAMGLTGIAAISAVISDVSRGSYNIPQ